ncbi:hypothetical protein [Archangium sp.]|uniref:hypothetical protein n=1 Tax=Archangium sp. TaxID=1872627 RepID=UPI0039C8ACD5
MGGWMDVSAVAIGNAHTVVLKADGTVWSWAGTSTASSAPVRMTHLNNDQVRSPLGPRYSKPGTRGLAASSIRVARMSHAGAKGRSRTPTASLRVSGLRWA